MPVLRGFIACLLLACLAGCSTPTSDSTPRPIAISAATIVATPRIAATSVQPAATVQSTRVASVAIVSPLAPPPTRVRATAAVQIVTATPAPTPTPIPTRTPLPPTATRNPNGFAASCPDPRGSLITDTIPAKTIVIELPVHVFLPPCYNPESQRYPVLYLLPGNEFEFGMWYKLKAHAVLERDMLAGRLPPFIVAMTDNDVGMGDLSLFNNRSRGVDSFEGYLLADVIPYIESKYSTWGSREGRAIGGISRGGYWALQTAFANPDRFSAVGAHSPVISAALLDGVPESFTMLDQARSISETRSLRIYLDAGTSDYAAPGVSELAEALTKNKIDHEVAFPAGSHEYPYWEQHVPEYLRFYSAKWPGAPRPR